MQVQEIVERGRALLRRPRPPAGLKSPPALSGGLPVLGHSIEFVQGTIELLTRAQRELGECAAFTVFNRKMVALFGPDAHEAVFRAPDAQLSPAEAYKIMTPVFGKDIVYDASPEKMAEQLKMLLPALKDKRMRTYGEAVVLETERSVRPWGETGVVDFVDFCRVLTNFTSSRCLLGKEFREGMTSEFASVYHDLEQGVTPLAYINAHLPIPSFRRRDKARVKMVEMITRIIDARRRDKREGEDFLQTLMDSRYADGRALSENEITGLLLAGMFAGHHTSSVTTAWTLIELLRNPTWLKACTEEVDRVFGGGKQPVSHAALRELTVVENAVKEALRLHPPLFMLVRVAVQDFTFKQWFIPKGTWIVLSPTVAQRMPDVFANPDAFEPDRFSPPREEDKRDFAFIAFGGGRHKCLGNAFAILQIKAILALLLGQYELELTGDPIESDFHGLVVGPKEPCRVRYRRRANPSVSMDVGAQLLSTTASVEAMAAAAGCPAHVAKDGQPVAAAAAGGVPSSEAVAQAAKAAGCPAHTNGAAATASPAPAVEAKPAAVEAKPAGKSKAGKAPKAAKPAADKPGKQMLVMLDRDLCQGHAVCVGEAPEVFRVGKDGKVELILDRPPLELEAKVRAAAKYCPTHTIRFKKQ